MKIKYFGFVTILIMKQCAAMIETLPLAERMSIGTLLNPIDQISAEFDESWQVADSTRKNNDKKRKRTEIPCHECDRQIDIQGDPQAAIIYHLTGKHDAIWRYNCKHCNQDFYKKGAAIHHKTMHKIHLKKCIECSSEYREYSAKLKKSTEDLLKKCFPPYTWPACEVCQEQISFIQLHKHANEHTHKERFDCSHSGCGANLQFASLYVHHRREHKSNVPKCGVCSDFLAYLRTKKLNECFPSIPW